MIDAGKRNLLGVLVDVVDYEAATTRIIDAAVARRPYGASALAVHGVMEGVADPDLRYRLNHLDLVTPDGQAVRWGLNLLHGTNLADRCYGPTLMLEVCRAAVGADLPVFLYGSTAEVLERLAVRLPDLVPGVQVAGTAPSRFARVPPDELDRIGASIVASGARITFVGLGCPRQEVFAYEMRRRVAAPVVAVGAAFDYHAGLLVEPPAWVQRRGLQWAWRLKEEPGRLWRRYASTNPRYLAGLAAQRLRLWRPRPDGVAPPSGEVGHA